MSRVGGVLLIALITLGIVVYGAPAWVFSKLTGGGVLSDWLSYDPSFYARRLPWLFVLWACQAVLLAIVTVRSRWNPMLRRVEIAMSLAVATLLTWFIWAGNVFVHATPDNAGKAIMGVAVVLILMDIAAKFYRGLGGVSMNFNPRTQSL